MFFHNGGVVLFLIGEIRVNQRLFSGLVGRGAVRVRMVPFVGELAETKLGVSKCVFLFTEQVLEGVGRGGGSAGSRLTDASLGGSEFESVDDFVKFGERQAVGTLVRLFETRIVRVHKASTCGIDGGSCRQFIVNFSAFGGGARAKCLDTA